MFPELFERQSRIIKYFHVVSQEPLRLQIQLHIFEVPIDTQGSSTPYAALSYTWEGLSVPTDVYDEHGILHQIHITESLASGLIQLYGTASDTAFPLLWADQLCIDQENTLDKVRQIPLMEDIFQHAEQVHVWLGNLDSRTEIAMRAIEMLGHDLQDLTGYQPGQSLVTNYRIKARDLLYDLGLGQLSSVDVWTLISEFCNKRWFSRAWILQEATVPDQPVEVHCGKYSIPFNLVVRVWHAVNNLFPLEDGQIDPLLKQINESGLRTLNILSYIRNPKNAPKTTLLDLRRICLGSQATDPRDKIYSIMGMASDWQISKYDLAVDYTVPLKQTYTSFAIWHILEHGNLDFLGEARPAHHSVRELPCWVPDWSQTQDNMEWISLARRSVTAHTSGQPIYNAGPPLDRSKLSYHVGDGTPEALTLKGVCIGRVSPLPHDGQWMANLTQSGFWQQQKSNICQGLSYEQIAERTWAADTYQDNDTNSTFYQHKRGAYFRFSKTKNRNTNRNTPRQCLFETSKHKMSRKHLFLCDGTKALGLEDEWILGSGPDTMQIGDELWMLHGGQVLYILRPFFWHGPDVSQFNASGQPVHTIQPMAFSPSQHYLQTYDFVGDAFALGLMDGELHSGGRFQHAKRGLACLVNPFKEGLNPAMKDHFLTRLRRSAIRQYRSPFGRSDRPLIPKKLSPTISNQSQQIQSASPFGRLEPDGQLQSWIPGALNGPGNTSSQRPNDNEQQLASLQAPIPQQRSPFGRSGSPGFDRYVAFSNVGTIFGR